MGTVSAVMAVTLCVLEVLEMASCKKTSGRPVMTGTSSLRMAVTASAKQRRERQRPVW